MSYLNGPRINFWGGGSTNVDTANNTQYDPPIVNLSDAMISSSKSDEQLIDYLRQPDTREQQNYYTIAGWNYYGDHQLAFMDAKVSSSGQPGTVSTTGDLVGLPVYLLGSVDPVSGDGPYGGPVMVDLDPTSSQSTRIYVGGLQIGNEDPVLLVRHDTLCHSRFLGRRYDKSTTKPPYLTPGSVYGNGTFQLAFPKDGIVYDSSVQILKEIIDDPQAKGIVLRFSMFEFMPGMSTDQLQANYRSNRNDSNPSLGRIIGSIGPWYDDEPDTCPPGRLLQNNNLGGARGLAHLDSVKHRLTLDLISALPGAAIRQNGTANTTPIGPNVDYGELQIGTSAGVLVSTPSLPDTYYLYGGLYDVPLNADTSATLAKAPIVITSTQNALDISEVPVRIYSNDRNIYIDDVGGKASITLQVRELGGPLSKQTQLALSSDSSGSLPNADFLNFPAILNVPAGSNSINFEVTDNGGNAGFLALNIAGGDASYFINFRKYPADDFSAVIAAGNIPWDGPDGVYEQCLRFYYVLFPGMSKRIPLNDEATIQAVGDEILKRISTPYRNTTLCMPLTRSMSPGKIALLRAYLQ